MKNAVVVFLLRNQQKEILLAKKHKESEIGSQRWNGYGGKIEVGERPKTAAVREMSEETDGFIQLIEDDLSYGGVVIFHNSDGLSDFRVHIFYVQDVFIALPPDTVVMHEPTWFKVEEVSDLDMMPADKLILPLILGDKKKVIKGCVVFEQGFVGVKDFTYSLLLDEEARALLQEIETSK